MGKLRYGMLYDERVANFPQIRQEMWGSVAFCDWYVEEHSAAVSVMEELAEELDDLYVRAEARQVRLPVDAPQLHVVDRLDYALLDQLTVIRSHPEMFGKEIHECLSHKPQLGINVITFEEYDSEGNRVQQGWN